MKTPSVTPAQLLALAKFAVTFFVAQHFLAPGQARVDLQIASIVLPAALVVADAVIRHGRVKLAVELAAEAYQTSMHQKMLASQTAAQEPRA